VRIASHASSTDAMQQTLILGATAGFTGEG
jgi:hypothetical protein